MSIEATTPARGRLVCTSELDSSFPFSAQTLYNARSTGRYAWLSRLGPDNRRGRRLWIDAAAFNYWAACRGIRYRLEVEGATELEGGRPR